MYLFITRLRYLSKLLAPALKNRLPELATCQMWRVQFQNAFRDITSEAENKKI